MSTAEEIAEQNIAVWKMKKLVASLRAARGGESFRPVDAMRVYSGADGSVLCPGRSWYFDDFINHTAALPIVPRHHNVDARIRYWYVIDRIWTDEDETRCAL